MRRIPAGEAWMWSWGDSEFLRVRDGASPVCSNGAELDAGVPEIAEVVVLFSVVLVSPAGGDLVREDSMTTRSEGFKGWWSGCGWSLGGPVKRI